jgi:hypothetical protein
LTPNRATLRFLPEIQGEAFSLDRALQRLGVAALGSVLALAVGNPVRAQQPAVLSAQLYDQIHGCLGFHDGARALLIRNESHAADGAGYEDMIYDPEVALSSIAEAADCANDRRDGFAPAVGDARIAQARWTRLRRCRHAGGLPKRRQTGGRRATGRNRGRADGITPTTRQIALGNILRLGRRPEMGHRSAGAAIEPSG